MSRADSSGAEAGSSPSNGSHSGELDGSDRFSTQGTSLYIHVPFCLSKCAYCDFESAVESRASVLDAFADAVLASLDDPRGPAPVLEDVPTVYFGGGTPTVLGTRVARLIEGVVGRVGARPRAEVTVEANPETLDAKLVEELVAAGTTRVSLGVQSFDDDVLALLARCHDAARAEVAASVVRDAGVDFSVDLICGVPGQTMGSWSSTVLRAIATGAAHASVYPLTVEDGTRLAEEIESGAVAEPEPDAAAEQMVAAEELLEAAGLARYEIANYARPGCESRHNIGYWIGRPYVGVGPSAASMLDVTRARRASGSWVDRVVPASCSPGGRTRFVGAQTLDAFMGEPWASAESTAECLSPEQVAREDVMLGLRLTRGVPVGAVEKAALTQEMEDLEELGLVDCADTAEGEQRWRLTRRGWLLGNEVFRRVWTTA